MLSGTFSVHRPEVKVAASSSGLLPLHWRPPIAPREVQISRRGRSAGVRAPSQYVALQGKPQTDASRQTVQANALQQWISTMMQGSNPVKRSMDSGDSGLKPFGPKRDFLEARYASYPPPPAMKLTGGRPVRVFCHASNYGACD